MKIAQKLLAGVVAISTLMPLALLPIQVQAQQYNNPQSTPRIEGFNVDEVRRLVPGTELNFALYGTPNGMATLRIAGAIRDLTLVEIDAGQYEGTYTISARDKIVARSPVTANLRVRNQVASAVLNESLQIGIGAHKTKAMSGPPPKIERFSVVPVTDLDRGQELHFRVLGTSGGQVNLVIDGVKGKIILPEVKKGEYTNSYTIKRRDRITPNSVVKANLLLGDRTTSVILGQSLQSAAAPVPARAARLCHDCGTIEAVNQIEVKGDGGYLGTIGGGVIGGLLGNQVGGGSGKTAATIAGAVGGAFAGRAIEANARNANHYEVLVRMQNGTTQTLTFASDPGYRVGEKIRLADGVITRNP